MIFPANFVKIKIITSSSKKDTTSNEPFELTAGRGEKGKGTTKKKRNNTAKKSTFLIAFYSFVCETES